MIVKAGFVGLLTVALLTITAHREEVERVMRLTAQGERDLISIRTRESDIQDGNVRMKFRRRRESRFAAAEMTHLVTPASQQFHQRLRGITIVLDQKNAQPP